MYLKFNRLFAACVLVIFAFMALTAFIPMSLILPASHSVVVSQTQPPPDVPILDMILKIAVAFSTLAGISGLITALVAIATWAGAIKTDTVAHQWTSVLNLLAFVALVVFGVFRPDLDLTFLDSVAARIAAIALFVLGFLTQITVPGTVNKLLFRARVPVLGIVGHKEAITEMLAQTTRDLLF